MAENVKAGRALKLGIWVILFSLVWLLFPATATAQSPVALEAPANLAAIASGGSKVNLTWQDRSAKEEGFKIQRATDRAFSRDLNNYSVLADSTTYADDSVVQNTTYYYRVKAVTASLDSDWSNLAIVHTPFLVPGTPGNLTANSSRAFEVNLVWQDNSDNEAGFRVERATDAAFTANRAVFLVGRNVSNCTDDGVPGGSYYYRVQAFNSSADSAFSGVAGVTVSSKLDDGPVLVGFDTAQVVTSGFASSPPYFQLDRLGVLKTQDVGISFSDSKGFVSIAKGTTYLNAAQKPQFSLTYSRPVLLPKMPAGKVLLDAFEIGPSFSTMNPALKVTFLYEPALLPANQDAAKDLQMIYWDGKAWQAATGLKVDVPRLQINFTAGNFGIFALVRPDIPPGPQGFAVSDLHVFPQYSDPGEVVQVWATARNYGPEPGNYDLVLKLNKNLEETRSLSLEAGEIVQVNFAPLTKPTGTYNVEINGLAGTMVVRPAMTTRPPETTSSTSATSAAATTTDTEDTPAATPTVSATPEAPVAIDRPLLSTSGFGFLLGGIVVVVGVSAYLILRKK